MQAGDEPALREAANRGGEADPDVELARIEDPGYHLIGGGAAAFARAIGARDLRRTVHAPGVVPVRWSYVGAVALVTALVISPLAAGATRSDWPLLLLMAVLALGPASETAVVLVNRLASAFMRPARSYDSS